MTTNFDDIPYEEETCQFTFDRIQSQRRNLIHDALKHGLKLKAIDQDIAKQAQEMR